MAKQRRLKTRKRLMQEALERGINTPGGLARAIYGSSPKDRKARTRAVQLRYHFWKNQGSVTSVSRTYG